LGLSFSGCFQWFDKIIMADKKINRTKSFMFILPMLGKTILEFKNVLNCFVYADDERGQMYDNNIFILFKFDPSKDFSLFEKKN
jgi:hypothetical protein